MLQFVTRNGQSLFGAVKSATRQNRRHFLQALFTGAAGLTITWPAFSQTPGPPRITATKLTDRIAALSGAGGNVGAVIGNDGLLMMGGSLAHRAMYASVPPSRRARGR